MNASTPRDARTQNRLTRLGLLTEPAGYVDGVNLYQYVGSNPPANLDPLGQSIFRISKLIDEAKEGKRSMCEVFVDALLEYGVEDSFWYWQPKSSYSGSFLKGLNTFAFGPWTSFWAGIGFDAASAMEKDGKDLGFNDWLAPNGAYNFAHITGLGYAFFSSFGSGRIKQQLQEDLSQYEEARDSKAQNVSERCAELLVDLIALDYAEAAWDSAPKFMDEDPVDRRPAFDLKSKICKGGGGYKGYGPTKCGGNCDALADLVRERLKKYE